MTNFKNIFVTTVAATGVAAAMNVVTVDAQTVAPAATYVQADATSTTITVNFTNNTSKDITVAGTVIAAGATTGISIDADTTDPVAAEQAAISQLNIDSSVWTITGNDMADRVLAFSTVADSDNGSDNGGNTNGEAGKGELPATGSANEAGLAVAGIAAAAATLGFAARRKF